MELDALYCDVIVQRYEKFTGKKAERLFEKVEPTEPPPKKTPRKAGQKEA